MSSKTAQGELYQDDFAPETVSADYSNSKITINLDHHQVQLIVDVLKETGKLSVDEKLPTLLDVGCGCGVATSFMSKYFDRAIGVDASPNMIRFAEKRGHPSHVHFTTGTAEKLPVADESIDVVMAILSVHFFDIGPFVDECRRVLKQQGVAIFYTNNLTALTSSENDHLPIIHDEIIDVHRKSLVIAEEASHPQRHLLNDFQTHYNAIDWPGKRKLKKNLEISTNLEAVRDYFMSVPFYARLGKPAENPMIQLFEDTQKIWGMEMIDACTIQVRATFSATLIVLEKSGA